MNRPIHRLLDLPVVSRIRRNHALEHATIHLLTAQGPRTTLIGRADSRGFFLYGNVPTERVGQAAAEALNRLRSGEHQLAIHPNCGTNLLTAGLLAGSAAFLALIGERKDEAWQDRLGRWPAAILLATLALLVAQPLGLQAQRHLTTQGDPGNLEILTVRRRGAGDRTIHRVITRG
ncbi:MAG TPA: DUF6391 domain-containing protein [Anaerolineales bacterium]|jgi:hypothetical protein